MESDQRLDVRRHEHHPPRGVEELAWHPTVKPVVIVADAFKDCSRRGGMVLDPFAGSGTILIAAEQTGRRARGLEIDPSFVDVAIKRWRRFSGKRQCWPGRSKRLRISKSSARIGELKATVHQPGNGDGSGGGMMSLRTSISRRHEERQRKQEAPDWRL